MSQKRHRTARNAEQIMDGIVLRWIGGWRGAIVAAVLVVAFSIFVAPASTTDQPPVQWAAAHPMLTNILAFGVPWLFMYALLLLFRGFWKRHS